MSRTLFYIILSSSVLLFAQDGKQNVFLYTNEDSCTIYINNNVFGKGNLSIYLESGVYDVKIKKDLYNWDGEIITDSINVCDDSVITKKYLFEKKIYLSTSPQDVDINSGDKQIGYTPLFLNPDLKEISLSKKDYLNKNMEIPNGMSTVDINMDFIGTRPTQSFRKTPWFKVLIGTAVILGGTAAYYKIEADNNYEKYLATDNPDYLKKTDDFDTYSGLAFGALQINFAFILYYLLSD